MGGAVRHDQSTTLGKGSDTQRFGQEVGWHVRATDPVEDDFAVLDVLAHLVVTDTHSALLDHLATT